jgi:signal-transduction protein with cAMP-binding, CBS, and nucleotidyltransferase domain
VEEYKSNQSLTQSYFHNLIFILEGEVTVVDNGVVIGRYKTGEVVGYSKSDK